MRNCVTCDGEIIEERWEMGFRYCLAPECVKANYKGLHVVEIAQTKTNAVYKIMDEQTLRDMKEGKYRRDPVVVSRQATTVTEKAKGTFQRPKQEQYNRARVRFVQALADQGVRPDEIVQRGAYMHLTRQEVHRYMAGKRI